MKVLQKYLFLQGSSPEATTKNFYSHVSQNVLPGNTCTACGESESIGVEILYARTFWLCCGHAFTGAYHARPSILDG